MDPSFLLYSRVPIWPVARRSLVLPLQADLFPIVPTGVAGYCRVQARGHSRVWPLFVFLFISLLLILIPHRDDPVQLALSLIVSPLASGGPQFILFGPPPPGMLYIRRSRYVFDFGPPPPARLSRSLAGLPLQYRFPLTKNVLRIALRPRIDHARFR